MRMVSTVCGVVVTAVLCSGCLRKEVAETIYISPSGVVWSVLERDVRSDEKAPKDRTLEERDYVLGADTETHGVAQAFRQLGALSITTTWLRRERPYSVMTEARFGDLRQLAMAILRDVDPKGDATLVRNGCETTFSLRVHPDGSPEPSSGHAIDGLMTDLAGYRFVLTEGRFVSADGLTVLDEGTVAVPDPKKTAVDGVLTLALAWTDEGCMVKQ
jgi:hypothetical protein